MPSLSTLGRLLFAISMIASGTQQLLTGGFIRLVPPLPAWIPNPSLWAYLTGIVLIAAGGYLHTRLSKPAAAPAAA